MNRTVLFDGAPGFRQVTLVLAALLVCTSAPVLAQDTIDPAQLTNYTERVPTGFINWGDGFAQVDVEGVYDTQRFGASHAKIRAIEDAESKADDALYRLLRGININGQERLAGQQELEQALRKVIPKTRKMNIGKMANLTLNVKFTVPLYTKKNLAPRVYDVQFKDTDRTGLLAGTSGGVYTSVVFDASSTTLQAALFPRVLTEAGDAVYGPGVIDPKALTRISPARYVVRTDEKRKKSGLRKSVAKEMGENPLVIKVGKIAGDFLADIVLRDDQVEQMRQAQVGDLLAQGLVFIIQAASIDATGE